MNKEKITFVIPTIGRKSLINSINSLINQTNPNWNCIVVFDGIDKIEFTDERITSIAIPKMGGRSMVHGMSGLVRNEGLKLCKSEWIGFLDDDDTLDSNYVEVLMKKYKDYDFVIWRMIDMNGNIIPRNHSLIFGNVGISISFKNKFENLFFDRNRDGEDFDFIKKLLEKTNNYTISSEILYRVNC